jgi:hypothetical protein
LQLKLARAASQWQCNRRARRCNTDIRRQETTMRQRSLKQHLAVAAMTALASAGWLALTVLFPAGV